MMTQEELNTVKILKHNKELQRALKLKEKYESFTSSDEFWINFHQKEYQKLVKHLPKVLPTNLTIGDHNYSQVDLDLIDSLCYTDRFSKADGLMNVDMARAKLHELFISNKYCAFNIYNIDHKTSSRENLNYGHVIIAYRYEADIDWFRETHIIRLKKIISTKKGAISLLSKKLSKPLAEVLGQSPKNPLIPLEFKSDMNFPLMEKISWNQYHPSQLQESDMESSVLVSPKSWGFEGWYPVAQQLQLSENGRVDVILGNDQGQLLLIELQKGNISKDHYSKITVYRRQLAKDWGIDPKSIAMALIANDCNQIIRECCEEFNIQLILKPLKSVVELVTETRTLWESSFQDSSPSVV
jgi:hypothetical protein